MTFSRFFYHLLLFFLLNFIANLAKPIGFANNSLSLHHPVFFEIQRLPETSYNNFKSLIVDRDNRLIISTEHDVFIYEGGNYHKIYFAETPFIAYDGNKKIAIASGKELSILSINGSGYNLTRMISNSENLVNGKFTGVGIGRDNDIYLTSGNKLWRYNETFKLADSSEQNISIHSTQRGLVFHSKEKGFFGIDGKSYSLLNHITKTLNPEEKFLKLSIAGDFYFVSTSSKRMVMYNNQGILLSEIYDYSSNLEDLPIDVSTSDGVNFLAITHSKIYRFINPLLMDIIGFKNNLKGIINSSIIFDGEQFVATSYALYKATTKRNNLIFSVIEYGNFSKLYLLNDKLYVVGQSGLTIISNNQLVKITHQNKDYYGISMIHYYEGLSKYVINNDTLTAVEETVIDTSKHALMMKVGKTYSNESILLSYSPNISNAITFLMSKENSRPIPLFAINNNIKINDAFLDSDSTLWISTNNRLIRVFNNYLRFIRSQNPVLNVSNTSHNNITLEQNTEIVIRQGEPLVFRLNCLGPNAWQNPIFSYRIANQSSKPIVWTTKSTFSFDDLNPGNYTFVFKTKDALGLESNEIPINLRVIPNFLQTKFSLVALIILAIIVIYVINRWRFFYFALERYKLESIINRRTEELIKEKEKTDNLLARVLPRETASELKETGKVNTQKFNMATVLFSDIQGFTKITDELNPENLIDQLDKFFLYFDSVVDKYRIEKIKTIGDAYMCAGGIPHKNRTNPVEVVLAALEMLHFMREINLEHNPGQDIWDLRIGIDTGPVIAGVVGRNKLSYDIWGTTVNTASRMESSGEVGRINISGNTHIFVQDYFICTYRGKMPIKNKGDIEMYFVDGIKPALSNNFDIYKPNSDFLLQLQFLRFGDLEEFILEKLEKGLPKNLYYHNLKHTVDVYTQVELIGRSEDVSLEDQLLLQTAALFHDAGHLIDYDTHEEMGVKLAREILPEYQYSERQIQIISELILVTKLPPKPKNLLEAIMCDADLDYLGRTDFIPVSNNLYKELHEHGRIGTIQEWNEMQIKFIEKHQYFTNTARKLRNVNKNSQLDNIKNWIEKNKL